MPNHSEHRRFNQPSRKSSLNKYKADAEAAKAAAKKLMPYHRQNKQQKDALGPSFRCIHCIDPPAVNDVDGNGVIDSTGVAAATAAVVAAEQAYQDAKDALNHSEHRRFNQPSRKSSS